MSGPHEHANDPACCREELRDALSQRELDEVGPAGEVGAAGCHAAFRLAVALGRCRLFGIDLGDDLDGTLPANLAFAAAAALQGNLPAWAEEAHTLGQRWDAAADPFEADDLCVGLLGDRMDAWAACIALDEAHQDCLEKGEPAAAAFPAELDRLHEALARFDDVLQGQEDLLSVVAGTELLNNWRGLLAAPYQEDLPWWLDGRLEEAARRGGAAAVAAQPGSGFWVELRRQWLHYLGASYPASVLPPLLAGTLAYADTGREPALPGQELWWHSPDGRWQAKLRLPDRSDPQEESRPRPLRFSHRDQSTGSDLAGCKVRVAGAAGEVDQAGRAWFTLAQLRAATELDLWVGEPPELWSRVSALPGENADADAHHQ